MANCPRCGDKLPFFSFRENCASCRAAMARFGREEGTYVNPVPRLTDPNAKLYVTTGLLALNVIVYLAMLFEGGSITDPSGEILVRFGGSWGPYTLFTQPWRLLTYNFVHSGIIHIGFNMWCLWDLGGLAERIFDRWVYLLTYLCCGVAGGLAASLFSFGGVTVGASGAIFGIAGALISALYLGKLPVARHAIQSTLRSLVFFAGYNLVFGMIVPHISNSAHMGGFITGLILGAVLARSLTIPSSQRQVWSLAAIAGYSLVLLGGFFFVRSLFIRFAG